MSPSRDQAAKNIELFIKNYQPFVYSRLGESLYKDYITAYSIYADYHGEDPAYTWVMSSILSGMDLESGVPFSVDKNQFYGDPAGFVNALPPEELVRILLPATSPQEASSAASLIRNGALSPTDFLESVSIAGTPPGALTVEAILKAAETINTPPAFGPFPRLDIQELTDSQQDFLTSVYVGAFGRAPEYEGLMFWARDLIKVLPQGERSAFNFIGEQMYIAGAGNNEGGTHLPHADYIHFAYNNVLGREAEPDGYNFWLNELNSGAVNRGNFIATFIGGVGEGRDATFLDARLAVASYVAQEHVSGRSAPPIDLRGVLNGVVDMPSAAQTIEQLEQISLVGIVLTFDLPIS